MRVNIFRVDGTTVHNTVDAYETHTSCDADLPTFQRFWTMIDLSIL